jgi:5-methylcytosine-specific restriction endonuclease McrA
MKLAFRQGHRCVSCRELLHWDSQVDHIVPWSLSADDSDDNVQILCPTCHANKSGDEARKIKRVVRLLRQPGMDDLNQAVCWECMRVVSTYFDHTDHNM